LFNANIFILPDSFFKDFAQCELKAMPRPVGWGVCWGAHFGIL